MNKKETIKRNNERNLKIFLKNRAPDLGALRSELCTNDSFKQQIPLYLKRLEFKPGVTGWAQVKWRYDESIEDVKEKLNYDLYYINNHSLWLDIKIIFLTFSTVFLQKGQ